MNKGMSGHQSADSRTNEWLTPPEILRALGEFDLDPCAPVKRPWSIARHHFTIEDNGLAHEWFGRVWLNPPYSTELIKLFMKRMAGHHNGIALTFARTETEFFHKYVWPSCDSILFIEGRIAFHNTAGIKAKMTGGAPSCLIAYGEHNVDAIASSGIKGKHLLVNSVPIVIVGISPSWKSVVTIALSRLNGTAHLQAIYDVVELIAPDKIERNQFYKEKIRQTLQNYFTRINKGIYGTN